jgi:general secretion pathway protein A
MEYYDILNFKKEPFSNSPEPEFFFEAPKHMGCLQKLELAIRLRRGLNVVIGDVGTGKTTLCRKLIRQFSLNPKDSQEIETHLLLDPSFDNASEFLQTVSMLLGIKEIEGQESEWQLKEKIKDYLFNKGVNEQKIIVLIIDEGQKIPENCLEILREFLNYETNNFKLLQIIIFAQKEFRKILDKRLNLSDRINNVHYLKPLNFKQMRAMVRYRINVSRDLGNAPALFGFWALLAIYFATGGYPRKIVSLCHQVILMMIIRGRKKADFFLVMSCLKEMYIYHSFFRRIKWVAISSIFMVIVIAAGAYILQNTNINLYEQFSLSKIISGNKQTVAAPIIPAASTNVVSLPVPAIKAEVQNIPSAAISAAPSTNSSVLPVPAIVKPDKENNLEKKMPVYLGKMRLEQGGTLWGVLQDVYENTSWEMIKAVIAVNQQISNPNKITAGKVLNLPAIPADISPLKEGEFLIQLTNGKDLQAMHRFFQKNSIKKSVPKLIFFPCWNKKDGMTFAIIIDKCFNDSQEAKEVMGKLPNPIAGKTKIISQWDTSTVFFNWHTFSR